MAHSYVHYDKINFGQLRFHYFIKQGDGTIIGSAIDEEGNEITCAIAQDGTVRHRRNQGFWKELTILDAASLRYFAGKFFNRSVPTYHTNRLTV